ncbi:MAG: transposase [Actinomycetota bacterium]|nr:transposase [Actinomycetota bacterium]
MPRAPRIHVRNGVYHVTQRATGREILFIDAIDHDVFDRLLDIAVKRARWKLHAYCHMTNHIHLLVQTPEPTLAKGMQFLLSQYVQEFNVRHGRRGALVEGRYKSRLVETSAHYVSCLQYFAMNPVSAGLCDRPDDWPWSSYAGVEERLRSELDAVFA